MGGGIASVGPTPKKVLAVHPVFNSVQPKVKTGVSFASIRIRWPPYPGNLWLYGPQAAMYNAQPNQP